MIFESDSTYDEWAQIGSSAPIINSMDSDLYFRVAEENYLDMLV